MTTKHGISLQNNDYLKKEVMEKEFKVIKIVSAKIKLLIKTKLIYWNRGNKNFYENAGEIDVRHSFDEAIKSIDRKQPMIDTPNAEYLDEQNLVFQKVAYKNPDISSKSSKIRLSMNYNSISYPQQNVRNSTSSSSKFLSVILKLGLGKRLLNNNPIYQNKYVANNRSEIRHKIKQFMEDKSVFFPDLKEVRQNNSKISINLRRNFAKTRMNRSQERTSILKQNKMSVA